MSEKNVFQRLSEAREIFHKSAIKPSGKNSYANYSYFELGDILPIAMSASREAGIITLDTIENGQMYLDVVNIDKPDDRIRFSCPMSKANLKGCHEVQNLGAVITYTKRYLYTMAFEVIEHDALDATTGKEKIESNIDPFFTKQDYANLEDEATGRGTKQFLAQAIRNLGYERVSQIKLSQRGAILNECARLYDMANNGRNYE